MVNRKVKEKQIKKRTKKQSKIMYPNIWSMGDTTLPLFKNHKKHLNRACKRIIININSGIKMLVKN